MQLGSRFLTALMALLLLFTIRGGGDSFVMQEAGDATAVQRVRVANERGADLLKQGDVMTAVKVLDAVSDDIATIPPQECGLHFEYFHHSGEALVRASWTEPALLRYWQSFESCPRSLRALETTLRLSRQIPSTRTALQVDASLAEHLLVEGDLQTTEQILRRALSLPDQLRGNPAPRLVHTFARYCATAPVDSDQFRQDWMSLLGPSRLRLRHTARARVDCIISAYYGDLPSAADVISNGVPAAWGEFPSDGEALAELLKTLGDESFMKGDEGIALERYALAWALNRDDVTRALYLMNLLASARRPIDPEGLVRGALAAHFSSWTCDACDPEAQRSYALLLSLLRQAEASP